MKNFILIAFVVFTATSCTKTKTNTVTVIQHDTLSITPTLVGEWKSNTGASPLTFTASTFTLPSYPAILYSTVSDTIFDKSPADVIWQRWTYKISAHNDTLWLTGINPTIGTTDIYTKN